MSTNATIAHRSGEWHLYEEMNQEDIWIDISEADFEANKFGVVVRLPPELIDAIRAAKPECFPHLRKKCTL